MNWLPFVTTGFLSQTELKNSLNSLYENLRFGHLELARRLYVNIFRDCPSQRSAL